MKGWLSKRSRHLRRWRRRWMIVEPLSQRINYFLKEPEEGEKPRNSICLVGARVRFLQQTVQIQYNETLSFILELQTSSKKNLIYLAGYDVTVLSRWLWSIQICSHIGVLLRQPSRPEGVEVRAEGSTTEPFLCHLNDLNKRYQAELDLAESKRSNLALTVHDKLQIVDNFLQQQSSICFTHLMEEAEIEDEIKRINRQYRTLEIFHQRSIGLQNDILQSIRKSSSIMHTMCSRKAKYDCVGMEPYDSFVALISEAFPILQSPHEDKKVKMEEEEADKMMWKMMEFFEAYEQRVHRPNTLKMKLLKRLRVSIWKKKARILKQRYSVSRKMEVLIQAKDQLLSTLVVDETSFDTPAPSSATEISYADVNCFRVLVEEMLEINERTKKLTSLIENTKVSIDALTKEAKIKKNLPTIFNSLSLITPNMLQEQRMKGLQAGQRS